jgi:hypothetical protein
VPESGSSLFAQLDQSPTIGPGAEE